MSDDTMIDVMGETADVALETYTKEEPGTHPFKITKVEWYKGQTPEGADTPMVKLNVNLVYANGPYEGREKYHSILWSFPRKQNADGTTTIVPSENAVNGKVADGMSMEEAIEKSIEGAKTAELIGKQSFTKLQNAAGFIRAKDTKSGDNTEARVNMGAKVMEADGTFTDGSGKFELSMLEGRYVMGKTKLGKKRKNKNGEDVQYVEIASLWDIDPTKVGDLGMTLPF